MLAQAGVWVNTVEAKGALGRIRVKYKDDAI